MKNPLTIAEPLVISYRMRPKSSEYIRFKTVKNKNPVTVKTTGLFRCHRQLPPFKTPNLCFCCKVQPELREEKHEVTFAHREGQELAPCL